MHIENTDLLPDDTMLIRYEAPDDLRVEESQLADLPEDWRADQHVTRSIGDAWLDRGSACLLRVPSVIVPIPDADDRNVLSTIDTWTPRASRFPVSGSSRTTRDCSRSLPDDLGINSLVILAAKAATKR